MGGQHQRVDTGQAWTSQRYKGQQMTGRGGDSWLRGHLGYGIDDDERETFNIVYDI